MPRDFLYYDEENKGMVWLWALTESGETHDRLHKEVYDYIKASDILELDIHPNRYPMGHYHAKSCYGRTGLGTDGGFYPCEIEAPG